jgi:kynurenine 3-monooxygenase
VPFHGQGANCAFEDCRVLAQMLEHKGLPATGELATVFDEFAAQRRPDTEAIAQMALENYTEMRDSVRDPRFARLKALSLQLERRHPRRFIPRYSMVMFHAGIPYAEALRRGEIQTDILERIDELDDTDAAALALADQLIAEQLPEFAHAQLPD